MCNVFYDSQGSFNIREIKHEIYKSRGLNDGGIRWHNLRQLSGGERDTEQRTTLRCSVLDSACRESDLLQENIFLISDAFEELAGDNSGGRPDASFISLLPRLVFLRLGTCVRQAFAIQDGSKMLDRQRTRERLAHYWRYAVPLIGLDETELAERIGGHCRLEREGQIVG